MAKPLSKRPSEGPPRVMAVSSGGGHWVQLCRLAEAWQGADLITVCTAEAPPMHASVRAHHRLTDATRWDRLALFKLSRELGGLMLRERPQIVITTGAAPGLIALLWGRLLGARTIWIDSLANVKRLSASGRVARWIAHECLTQWPHLQRGRGPDWQGSVW